VSLIITFRNLFRVIEYTLGGKILSLSREAEDSGTLDRRQK